MVEKTVKWPLLTGTLLKNWTVGKLVILGDAAHAMVPYMSQGWLSHPLPIAIVDGVTNVQIHTGS